MTNASVPFAGSMPDCGTGDPTEQMVDDEVVDVVVDVELEEELDDVEEDVVEVTDEVVVTVVELVVEVNDVEDVVLFDMADVVVLDVELVVVDDWHPGVPAWHSLTVKVMLWDTVMPFAVTVDVIWKVSPGLAPVMR